jgi:hypothetical protein
VGGLVEADVVEHEELRLGADEAGVGDPGAPEVGGGLAGDVPRVAGVVFPRSCTMQIITRVGIEAKGSTKAVVGSGTRSMSLSLIACQPRMLEPSNPRPSAKVSSSSLVTGIVKCCQAPRKSVNRRSTALTSFSRHIASTSRGFMRTPRGGGGFKNADRASDHSIQSPILRIVRSAREIHRQRRVGCASLDVMPTAFVTMMTAICVTELRGEIERLFNAQALRPAERRRC